MSNIFLLKLIGVIFDSHQPTLFLANVIQYYFLLKLIKVLLINVGMTIFYLY